MNIYIGNNNISEEGKKLLKDMKKFMKKGAKIIY